MYMYTVHCTSSLLDNQAKVHVQYIQLAVEQLLEVKYLYHRNVHSTNQLIPYPPLHSPIQWSIVTNSRHNDNSIAGQLSNLWYVHVQVGYHYHTCTVLHICSYTCIDSIHQLLFRHDE